MWPWVELLIWRFHRKPRRACFNLPVFCVVPETTVKSRSGSDLRSDNLRRWALGGSSMFSGRRRQLCGWTRRRFVYLTTGRTQPTTHVKQPGNSRTFHRYHSYFGAFYRLRKYIVFSGAMMCSDFINTARSGGWSTRCSSNPGGLMMFLYVSSLHVVPAPLPLPKGHTDGDVKETRGWLSMRSPQLWHRFHTSARRLLLWTEVKNAWLLKEESADPQERPVNFDFAEWWSVEELGVRQVQVCERFKPSICQCRAAMLLGNWLTDGGFTPVQIWLSPSRDAPSRAANPFHKMFNTACCHKSPINFRGQLRLPGVQHIPALKCQCGSVVDTLSCLLRRTSGRVCVVIRGSFPATCVQWHTCVRF